jgi:Tfp pilus assembly protein PilN
MLRTNLASKPFYNVRAVRLVLGIVGAVAVALVLFDIVRLVTLSAAERSLGARAVEAEAQAKRLLAEADQTRKQIDPTELETVAAAAREANGVIDRRAFSWTALFERLEATLPADVRITAVSPNVGTDGDVLLTVTAEARRAEDLDAFVEALEGDGAFRNVLAVDDRAAEDGTLEATIQSTYSVSPREAEAVAVETAGSAQPEARP